MQYNIINNYDYSLYEDNLDNYQLDIDSLKFDNINDPNYSKNLFFSALNKLYKIQNSYSKSFNLYNVSIDDYDFYDFYLPIMNSMNYNELLPSLFYLTKENDINLFLDYFYNRFNKLYIQVIIDAYYLLLSKISLDNDPNMSENINSFIVLSKLFNVNNDNYKLYKFSLPDTSIFDPILNKSFNNILRFIDYDKIAYVIVNNINFNINSNYQYNPNLSKETIDLIISKKLPFTKNFNKFSNKFTDTEFIYN